LLLIDKPCDVLSKVDGLRRRWRNRRRGLFRRPNTRHELRDLLTPRPAGDAGGDKHGQR
jgi:hypothetical protein